MKLVERRVYRGPNLYAHFPVIRLTLDLEGLEEWPSARIPGFVDGLVAAIPSLAEHGCSYGEPGGFIRRLREDDGTWMGHIIEHVAIELQQLAGADVTFGKTRGAGDEGVYTIVYAYEEERVGLEAAQLAIALIENLLPKDLCPEPISKSDDFDYKTELEELIGLAQRRQFGPSTAALIRAAEERDIPWIRLNDYSLVQFGHGRYQKRIQATITSETRHIAVEIASDKEETNQILTDLGLPVPRQQLVRTVRAAVQAAERMGYPVVVKPLNANHGRGVSLNLMNTEDVEVAVGKAKEHSRSVLVEKMITGFDHRMLVVNGDLIAVAKRVPGHVIGDGTSTISELVEAVNRDPRRGIGHEKVLTRLEFDHQAERLMNDANYTTETVLAANELFYIRSTGNLSTGGTAIDLTDEVHPDNREMAMRAATAIGLDVAGIDFLTPDITRSYRDIGGAICEVNAAPGFRMHVAPTEGQPRDVAGPVIDMLFPSGTPTRIPIAAITGTNGKTTTSRMVAHILKMSGARVGLTTTDGVYIDGERTAVGDMTGPMAARMVLRDPKVDTAVLETARGGLIRAGLGFRRANVSAVLNVSADHLGLGGIDTVEQLAEIKRVVAEIAKDCAVLNADDIHCLHMADYTKADRIGYVTMNPRNDLVRQHIQADGLAAVLEEGINGQMITLYDQGRHMPLMWTQLIPATLEGRATHNVQNAMFAALIAYAMNVRVDNIRQGLRTFDTSFFQVPGRLNVFDELPFKVILDYGHNPAAVRCMVDMVQRLDVNGRRLCVIAAPGDRRDEDIVRIAELVAEGEFDQYVLRRDDRTRGRGDEEVPRMMEKVLLEKGISPERIHVIPLESEAVEFALSMGETDDLLLIFGDNCTRTWKQIINFDDKVNDEAASASTTFGTSMEQPSLITDALTVTDGEFITDGRGVRLARLQEED
jgi:cyanophycin synthetase